MQENTIQISIVIPFYKGNKFLKHLLGSIDNVASAVENIACFEVIIVNDSPDVAIELPETKVYKFTLKVYCNEKNQGIQKTRANGVKYATGQWIVFLDQDDELLLDGFEKQINLTKDTDVVVGNGLYEYGDQKILIYKNQKTMRYLIQKRNFIGIRNLIPAPGECMIRKEAIPQEWLESPLCNNGADDWLLWILLFQNGARFSCNEQLVYIHNNSDGENLSLNMEKMYISALEMCECLHSILPKNEYKRLVDAVCLKFLKDTAKLDTKTAIKYWKTILDNIIYKTKRFILEFEACNVLKFVGNKR